MHSQKQQNDHCLFPRKPFNITVIQVYAPTSNAEEAEVERFYEDLLDLLDPIDLLDLTPKQRIDLQKSDLLKKNRLNKNKMVCGKKI